MLLANSLHTKPKYSYKSNNANNNRKTTLKRIKSIERGKIKIEMLKYQSPELD